MQVSTKARYALRIMIDLAVHNGSGKVKIKEISKRQNISVKYLEQVISALSKDGLVRGERGPQGGYVLNVDPASVTAGDIIRSIDGPTAPAPCTTEDGDCQLAAKCATMEMWQKIGAAADEIMDSYTLAQLAESSRKLIPVDGEKLDYCI